MPELPEVETIARSLREGGRSGPPIASRIIQQVHIFWLRTLAEPRTEPLGLQAAETILNTRLAGQKVLGITRRAKFLVIGLEKEYFIIHLRMSGDLRVEPEVDGQGNFIPFKSHDRLAISFIDGWRLAFNDPRKFGRVWLVEDPLTVLGNLGPEPFDALFTPEVLYGRMRAVNRQMKPLLLDQSFIAGLGNIYTDEALHLARIHPLRPSSSINFEQAERLWNAIREVLSEGIHRNGASIDWVYQGGDFQNHFQVYQRTGEPCFNCGAQIVKIAVGQRGTHFCPVCQPKD